MQFKITSISLLAIGASAAALEKPALIGRACSNSAHTVSSGDTLSSIAKTYSSTVCAIAAANGITDKNMIYVKQGLQVPLPGCTLPSDSLACCIPASSQTTHSVVSGDTFFSLSLTYGVSVSAIESANPSASAASLAVGSSLTIPARAASNC